MSIFWEQIRKARDYAEKICDEAVAGRSVVLSFPDGIPWCEELYIAVEDLLLRRSCNYAFRQLEDDSSPLDSLLLENFCRRELRAQYRQNIGVARFLSRHSESTLHSTYVWVRISSGERLQQWLSFASEYSSLMPQGEDRASFIFVVEGLETVLRTRGISILEWRQAIDAYDVYTFCALVSSETDISPVLRPYLVELSSRLCENDVELARACVLEGKAFLSEPEKTLMDLVAFTRRSNGEAFRFAFDHEECVSLIWEAQIRCLFAILEKYRSAFVRSHRAEICACLPISDGYGQLITEPNELELGQLIYLVGDRRLYISQDEYDTLDFHRHARNELAHMNILPFEEVKKLLTLRNTL